jgi:hypothetical protein
MAANCVKSPRATPRPAGDAEQDGEPFAHADALAACLRIFEIGPTAADKDNAGHQAKQQESEIGEAGKLGKHAEFENPTLRLYASRYL